MRGSSFRRKTVIPIFICLFRTDIGGVYALNTDGSWLPLLDWANDTTWDFWGSDALATDPVQTENLYIAAGMYTNSWDPNNGTILKSKDKGRTFTTHPLPFKVGGNMPGRGMGERLAIDPNNVRSSLFSLLVRIYMFCRITFSTLVPAPATDSGNPSTQV